MAATLAATAPPPRGPLPDEDSSSKNFKERTDASGDTAGDEDARLGVLALGGLCGAASLDEPAFVLLKLKVGIATLDWPRSSETDVAFGMFCRLFAEDDAPRAP